MKRRPSPLSTRPWCVLAVMAIGVTSATAAAQDEDFAGAKEVFPGVTLDAAAGHVDLRARVVGRHVDWLELLACRPGTREHESIVTVDADARHIQLALLLLGLEAGSPARAEEVDGEIVFYSPTGPRVELFFVLDESPQTPIPARDWVVSQTTGEPLPDNVWLFVGSQVIDFDGQRHFLAEANGTVASLVNFGDELLGRATDVSEAGGNGFWTTDPDTIPPEGTRLTLRIKPIVPPPPE
ncbi:MAG: YdjY domain-containing protein [Planctomycetota bacterium]